MDESGRFSTSLWYTSRDNTSSCGHNPQTRQARRCQRIPTATTTCTGKGYGGVAGWGRGMCGHTVTWSGAFQAEHLNTVGRWCRRRLLGGEALALYTVQSTSANLTDLAHSHRRYCRGPWRVRQQRELAEVLSDVPPDDFLCTLCTATHAPSTQAKPYDHNPAPRTQFSRVT